MELQQLIYFSEVAKLQNLTKAASILYVSQPALSKSIHRLEEELDTQLFLRIGKNLQLTDHGQAFYEHTRKILEDLDAAKQEIARLNREHAQTVRLKIRALAGLLPNFLREFTESNPEISVVILQGTGLVISENEYDLLITPSSEGITDHNSKLLLKEKFCLFAPADSGLANKEQCSLSDLRGIPYIHTTDQFFVWEFINSQFERYDYMPKIRYQCDEPSSILNLTRAGYGVSIVPEYSFPQEMMQGVKKIPLQEPEFFRNIYLTWKDGVYLPKPIQLCRKSIGKYFSREFSKDNIR